jgi:hypothetical protein
VDIFPYAYEFFKVFLDNRKEFVIPAEDAHYWPYDLQHNEHADWPKGAWIADTLVNLRLGVIDFRYLLGVENKVKSSTGMP